MPTLMILREFWKKKIFFKTAKKFFFCRLITETFNNKFFLKNTFLWRFCAYIYDLKGIFRYSNLIFIIKKFSFSISILFLKGAWVIKLPQDKMDKFWVIFFNKMCGNKYQNNYFLVINFSKFYGKVGVIFWFIFLGAVHQTQQTDLFHRRNINLY